VAGGRRPRVALARATVTGRGVWVADAAAGKLVSRPGAPVLDLLARLQAAGRTLVVVTHDPGVARRADRVVVLRDGEIVRRVAGADVTDLGSLFDEANVASA
ncbi:MAG: ABC transporter ATP-binding protein, partial [Proteobacteria bacterium]|nr:ABC transporter ATP-binding protein [Pseudomonadota bacterium]